MNVNLGKGVTFIVSSAIIAGTSVAAAVLDWKRTRKYNKVSDEVIETEGVIREYWQNAKDENIAPTHADAEPNIKPLSKNPAQN